MTTLLNRVCTLCETETWLEGGFVQCDCRTVPEYEWSMGVIETPKHWDDDVDALMYYRQKHYEGMIDNQSELIVLLRKENKEFSELIFDLRGENYALRERVANLEKMITRSA